MKRFPHRGDKDDELGRRAAAPLDISAPLLFQQMSSRRRPESPLPLPLIPSQFPLFPPGCRGWTSSGGTGPPASCGGAACPAAQTSRARPGRTPGCAPAGKKEEEETLDNLGILTWSNLTQAPSESKFSSSQSKKTANT